MSAALKIPPDAPRRELLRQAIAARDAITARMASATKRRDEAEEAERQAQAAIEAQRAATDLGWSMWVQDRSKPQPIEAPRQRAELTAIRHAAGKAATAARAAYAEAETVAQRDLPAAQAAIVDAARAVLIAEAEQIGHEYAHAVERAQRLEAALMGLRAAFAATAYGDGVAAVMVALRGNRSIADAERRHAILRHESAAIQDRWRRLAERLTSDADAVEELT
jgi:hypothetical protein